MFVFAFAPQKIKQIAASVTVAVLTMLASEAPARSQGGHMLVIPASDGYGFDDCLSANKACGHVIADAWCEAHGLTAATSFGKAEDITATVADGKPTGKIEPNSYVVSCRD